MISELVTVKRSKRAKRVALRLDPVERVINLVIPERMSLKRAYKFASDHEDWVKQTLEALPAPVPFTDGTMLTIFGDPVRLDIEVDTSLKRTRLTQTDDLLYVKTYQPDPSNRIKAHLKKIAKTGLADMASDKAGVINLSLIHI